MGAGEVTYEMTEPYYCKICQRKHEPGTAMYLRHAWHGQK